MEEFSVHFLPLLQRLFILLVLLFIISAAHAFIENIKIPGRTPPLEIEYMGTQFRARRLLIGISGAVFLNLLLILFNPLVQSFFGGQPFFIAYLFLVFLGGAAVVYCFDQFIFLSGVAGVFLSNILKK